MNLESGQTLSHYRLTGQIGEGGMGVVWRATDTTLDRDVAIKVLPASFAESPERLARFAREAKTLASLNHPNIGHIYGLVEHAGCSAIVLELIEGETLADRIARGPLPEPEARQIALQIAEALEWAHERGVVHRDLKPANVKITPQGTVKVLDFGLAKTLQPDHDTGSQSAAHSPTLTAMATQAGMIMGTAAYMSPEQARGKEVDRRADIWAFGCVLYEMLVGRSPFPGDDVSEIMARVITLEPDFDRLPGGLPARVDELIRRCLRKDARMRLSDMGTARIALHEADAPSSTAASPAREAASTGRSAASLRVVGVVGLLGLSVGALLSWVALRSPEAPQAATGVRQFDLVLDPPPSHWEMTLSADGKTLVYSGRGTGGDRLLYIRELDGFESRAISGTEDGHVPFFSPDGQHIGFFSAGRLKRVSLLGGLPTAICAVAGEVSGAAWTPDDEIVYATVSTKVPYRVGAQGGEGRPVEVRDLEPGATVGAPRLVPGGSGSVLVTVQAPSLDGPQVGILDLASGRLKTLIQGLDARYLPSGELLFVQQERLVSAPFDTDRLELTGPERAVSLAAPAVRPGSGDPRFYSAVSAAGMLIYPVGRFGETRLSRLSRDGQLQSLGMNGQMVQVDSSGRRLLISESRRVTVFDTGNGETTQVTFSSAAWYPKWFTTDGRVVLSDFLAGRRVVVRMTLDGSSIEELTDPEMSPASPVATSVGPDGTVMGYSIDPENGRDIWAIAPDGAMTMVLATRHNERAGAISPDGLHFAYVSDEEGLDEIYIRELPASDRRWRVSTGGGIGPVWSRDGKELFYRRGDVIMATPVSGGSGSLRIGSPREVFSSDRIWLDRFGNPTYDTAPDGSLIIPISDPSNVHLRVVNR